MLSKKLDTPSVSPPADVVSSHTLYSVGCLGVGISVTFSLKLVIAKQVLGASMFWTLAYIISSIKATWFVYRLGIETPPVFASSSSL